MASPGPVRRCCPVNCPGSSSCGCFRGQGFHFHDFRPWRYFSVRAIPCPLRGRPVGSCQCCAGRGEVRHGDRGSPAGGGSRPGGAPVRRQCHPTSPSPRPSRSGWRAPMAWAWAANACFSITKPIAGGSMWWRRWMPRVRSKGRLICNVPRSPAAMVAVPWA